ncbi:MAG: HAD family hydrolase [Deltaproteobacteria bacterium]|nr:HAD family hydrolase [Deltaproteobacteria bacterium]
MLSDIRAIVFDLDGTLYVSDGLTEEIRRAVCEYAGRIKGISPETAADLIRETRERLSQTQGTEVTLSAVCEELGGDLAGFHQAITPKVHPEAYLTRDDRVVKLVTNLAARYDLYIYTNNNPDLTGRIMNLLGVCGLFREVFTIENFRRPKPDRSSLEKLFSAIDRQPAECLFVGDRYDVDLRVPAEMGSAVFLVTGVEELLKLALPIGERTS